MGLEREPTCYLRDRGTTTKCAGYFCMFRLGPQSSHTRCPHSHTGTRLFFVEADRTFHLLTQMPFETLVDHDKHAQTHFNNAYDLGSWQQFPGTKPNLAS